MKLKSDHFSKEVLEKITKVDPLEGEDIIIENSEGEVIGVILQPKAYAFFLKKVEEKENAIDSSLNDQYDPSAPTLEDLMGE